MNDYLAAAAAPLTQFARLPRAHSVLSRRGPAAVAILSSVVISLGVFVMPVLLTDIDEAAAGYAESVRLEAVSGGMGAAAADSLAAAGAAEMSETIRSMPAAMLLERIVMTLVSGLAAFGLFRAFGFRDGAGAHLRTAVLAQAAYSISWGLLVLVETLFPAVAPVPGLEAFLGAVPADPGRAFTFSWLVLSACNIPSAAAVAVWGGGMAVATGRSRSSTLGAAAGMYLCGVILFSMPVLLPAGGGSTA